MKIILIGSTGLVGQEVLKLLIADSKVDEIITPVRSGHSLHAKHLVLIYDFDKNENLAEFKNANVIICTLGSTMKKAKTKEIFRKVDFDYPLNFARIGLLEGVSHFILNSATGASSDSLFFYNQVKGQIEDRIRELNFKKYTIVRPGLIGGDRSEFRFFERLALRILTICAVMLPDQLKINPAHKIAKAICDDIHREYNGERIISSEKMI